MKTLYNSTRNVVILAVTSRRPMPERRSAHAVSATPPAPPVANSRVAAWPASVISVLARIPTRDPPSTLTARNSTMCPRNETASNTSAATSQRGSPSAMRCQAPGASPSAGSSTSSDAPATTPAPSSTSALRRESPSG